MRVNAVGNSPRTLCATKNSANREKVNFNGYKMHLVDGGLHASTMSHFAKALCADVANYTKLILHEVDLLPHNSGLKALKSLDESLARLDTENIVKADDFVTIPCTAPIELNALSYHIGEKFTPENVKGKKGVILDYLKTWGEIGLPTNFDKEKQGLKHIPSIITSINNLVKKGVNVYVPSDHPLEAAIKWKAGDMGIKDSLYRFIATNYDEGGQIKSIITDLKSKNAYKFNLLTLSDAHVVNLQNRHETGDYIFSAYDSCITDKARGVYNFCPVRNEKGDILGYSFTDKTTVQFPFEEYYGNDDIANIATFVGRKTSDFSYEGNIVHIMKTLIEWEEPHSKLRNVPYSVTDIYSPKRIMQDRLLDKGQYTDRTETLFFDLNSDRELIFRKTDCEGSGRPSVVSMWGSCFAAVNLMTKNVRTHVKDLFDVKIPKLMKLAKDSEEAECYPAAENILKKALELAKPEVKDVGPQQIEFDIYSRLLELYKKQGRIDEAVDIIHQAFPNPRGGMQGLVEFKIKELRGEV